MTISKRKQTMILKSNLMIDYQLWWEKRIGKITIELVNSQRYKSGFKRFYKLYQELKASEVQNEQTP